MSKAVDDVENLLAQGAISLAVSSLMVSSVRAAIWFLFSWIVISCSFPLQGITTFWKLGGTDGLSPREALSERGEAATIRKYQEVPPEPFFYKFSCAFVCNDSSEIVVFII